jgi:DNA-binding transcriptional regulator GbsR (MarR family)
MGQYDILKALNQYPKKWLNILEIATIIKVSKESVSLNCKKLRKAKLVKYKRVDKSIDLKQKQFVYQCKHNKVLLKSDEK